MCRLNPYSDPGIWRNCATRWHKCAGLVWRKCDSETVGGQALWMAGAGFSLGWTRRVR